jgi:soluble lytic murein transglycosylase
MKTFRYIVSIFVVFFLSISALMLGIKVNSHQIRQYKNKISESQKILKDLSKKYDNLDNNIGQFTDLFNVYDILSQNFKGDKNQLIDIAYTIVKEAKYNHLDPYLILAIIKVESSFNITSVSHKGAMGLMQLKPTTAFYISEQISDINIANSNDLYDPILNLKIGINYLAYLRKKFDGNLKYAIIAYNIGPEKLRKIIEDEMPTPKRYYSSIQYNFKKLIEITKGI